MHIRILVVDDDPTSLRAVEALLSSNGYQVRTSAHAMDIEKVAEEFAPHLIIMDLMMPNVDGSQAVKRLQTYPVLDRIPVIFLTAVKMRDDERRTEFEISVDGRNYRTLTKPMDSKELLTEIYAMLHT